MNIIYLGRPGLIKKHINNSEFFNIHKYIEFEDGTADETW